MPYDLENGTLVPVNSAPDLAPAEVSDFVSADGAATYKDRLKRWAIAQLKPEKQHAILARFRRRSDADGHLRLLQNRYPSEKFLVIFDKQE